MKAARWFGGIVFFAWCLWLGSNIGTWAFIGFGIFGFFAMIGIANPAPEKKAPSDG